MANLNQVMLIGCIAKEPKLLGDKGVEVWFRLISVREDSTTGERKEFKTYLPVQFWGKRAEPIKAHGSVGQELFIQGSINTSSWEKDGVKQYRTVINAFSCQFLGSSVKVEASAESEQSQDAPPF